MDGESNLDFSVDIDVVPVRSATTHISYDKRQTIFSSVLAFIFQYYKTFPIQDTDFT